MCGIIGFVRVEAGKEIPYDLASEALQECSSRGKDATGFWSPLGLYKKDESADKFVVSFRDEIKKALHESVLIAHCRASTSGRPGQAQAHEKNPENNHPFESERYILVHNGIFRDTPEVKGYEYRGTCDTELAIALIEKYGIEKGISLMCVSDGFSLVIQDKQENLTYFYRNKNPLVITYATGYGALVFGSTGEIVEKLIDFEDYHGLYARACPPVRQTLEENLYCINHSGNFVHLGEIKLKPKSALQLDVLKDELYWYEAPPSKYTPYVSRYQSWESWGDGLPYNQRHREVPVMFEDIVDPWYIRIRNGAVVMEQIK